MKPQLSWNERFKKFRTKLKTLKEEKETAFAEAAFPKKTQTPPTPIEIPLVLIAKATTIILLLIFLFQKVEQISGILLIFFVSFILASALDPIVDYFQNFKVPRTLTVLIIYILFFLLSSVFIFKFATLIGAQLNEIAKNVSQFMTRIFQGDPSIPFATQLKPILSDIYERFDIQTASTQLQNILELASTQLINLSVGVMNVILVLILTFFMTVEEKAMEGFVLSLVHSDYAHYISSRLEAIKIHIGHWVRGQLILSLIAGLITYIGLTIMGTEYALTISAIAGVCMLIPVFGRVVAWILTVPIVYNQSPSLALAMSIFYFVVYQLEVNILIPYIMKKAVGLSPIIIIFAMMVGFYFLNVLGAIISIPLATMAAIFVKDYTMREKK